MNSVRTEKFRNLFNQLPAHIKKSTRKAYQLWVKEPNHPSLHFKKIHTKDEIYSVRISLGYRALAIKSENTFVWFWIGSHADYDEMIAKK